MLRNSHSGGVRSEKNGELDGESMRTLEPSAESGWRHRDLRIERFVVHRVEEKLL